MTSGPCARHEGIRASEGGAPVMLNFDTILGEWSFPLSGHSVHLEKSALCPSTTLGPRASLDTLERRIISSFSQESNYDSPDVSVAPSLYLLRNPGCLMHVLFEISALFFFALSPLWRNIINATCSHIHGKPLTAVDRYIPH